MPHQSLFRVQKCFFSLFAPNEFIELIRNPVKPIFKREEKINKTHCRKEKHERQDKNRI